MNILRENIRTLYMRYLFASVSSALAMCIYSFVDTIAVGHSEGASGAAAMAVISPLYGLVVFMSNLCGLGGAVLLSNSRGMGNVERGNEYFTASCMVMILLMCLAWPFMIAFHDEIMMLFGADEKILPKVMEYAGWIIYAAPLFMFPMFISSFIRNDNNPSLVMKAVITGGVLNIIGDYVFVFPMGMGMRGAAIATVLGSLIQSLIMGSHFFRTSCTLRFVMPSGILRDSMKVLTVGISSSILDFSNMGLVIIANNQIMRYGNVNVLAVYGCLVLIVSLVQAMYSGAGQALQPIASENFGAGNHERVRHAFLMSVYSVIFMCVIFAGVCEVFPLKIIRVLMNANPEVLREAPSIVRIYSLILIPMCFNVIAIYYLQSVMKTREAMLIAVMRSIALSGSLLFILPVFFGLNGVISALPVSELITCVLALRFVKGSL